MPDYGKMLNKNQTLQSKKASDGQIENSAGGYSFQVDMWQTLDRFIIMGVTGNTYYAKQEDIAESNAKIIIQCIAENGARVVKRLLEIRNENRALKQQPSLYTLALCMKHGDSLTRSRAYAAIPKMCGTFFHLTTLIEYRRSLNLGWGRGFRKGIARWYEEKSVDNLLYQALKYPNRNGWSQRDVMRKSHPIADSEVKNLAFKFITANDMTAKLETASLLFGKGFTLPQMVMELHQAIPSVAENLAVSMIEESSSLSREMLPTHLLKSKRVWDALNQKMPLGATIRNLSNMSKVGTIDPVKGNDLIENKLEREDHVTGSRLHPIDFMLSQKVYSSGRGVRGSNSWVPSQSIVASLEVAFYHAMKSVEPTGKSILLGIDISSSMNSGKISDEIPFTPSEICAVLACVMARVEKNVHIMGFSSEFVRLPIHKNTDIRSAMFAVQGHFGATDCALPMLYALGFNTGHSRWGNRDNTYKRTHKAFDVDCFVVLTDNETWIGSVHPHEALAEYRAKQNSNAKLIVCTMAPTSRSISIADPSDHNSLDIVGFDSAVPQLIQQFISK